MGAETPPAETPEAGAGAEKAGGEEENSLLAAPAKRED
jgi:hypothetical protein